MTIDELLTDAIDTREAQRLSPTERFLALAVVGSSYMAVADGMVHPLELAFLDDVLGRMLGENDVAETTIPQVRDLAAASPARLPALVAALADSLPLELRRGIAKLLISTVLADGSIAAAERDAFHAVAKALGVEFEDAEKILADAAAHGAPPLRAIGRYNAAWMSIDATVRSFFLSPQRDATPTIESPACAAPLKVERGAEVELRRLAESARARVAPLLSELTTLFEPFATGRSRSLVVVVTGPPRSGKTSLIAALRAVSSAAEPARSAVLEASDHDIELLELAGERDQEIPTAHDALIVVVNPGTVRDDPTVTRLLSRGDADHTFLVGTHDDLLDHGARADAQKCLSELAQRVGLRHAPVVVSFGETESQNGIELIALSEAVSKQLQAQLDLEVRALRGAVSAAIAASVRALEAREQTLGGDSAQDSASSAAAENHLAQAEAAVAAMTRAVRARGSEAAKRAQRALLGELSTIADDLPEASKAWSSSEGGILFGRKKLRDDLARQAMAFIEQRLARFQEGRLSALLKEELESLEADVQTSSTSYVVALRELDGALGVRPDAAAHEESAAERILRDACGWLAGGPVGAVAADSLGWGGVATNLGVNFAAGLALGALGIATGPVLIAVAAIVGTVQLIAGRRGAIERIAGKAAEAAAANLLGQRDAIADALGARIDERFEGLAEGVAQSRRAELRLKQHDLLILRSVRAAEDGSRKGLCDHMREQRALLGDLLARVASV